jgi:hypothetical protein
VFGPQAARCQPVKPHFSPFEGLCLSFAEERLTYATILVGV